MNMNEFLDKLRLWIERFPDLHNYDAIEKAVLTAKPDKKVGTLPSDVLRQFACEKGMTQSDINADVAEAI